MFGCAAPRKPNKAVEATAIKFSGEIGTLRAVPHLCVRRLYSIKHGWYWGEMIEPDPERKLHQIRSLIACPGWTEWLAPVLRERQEAIKEELLGDLTEKETAALRVEYATLKRVLSRPEQAQAQMVRRPEPAPAGNGAV